MKFIIEKSSVYNLGEKASCPLEGAVKETVDDIEYKYQKQVWTLDVRSLEALIDITKTLGEDIVIGRPQFIDRDGTPLYALEIYDDYRE